MAHSFQMCNSRKFPGISHIPRPVVLATFVLFLPTERLAYAAGADHHLTILHTNDLLGRLLPEPYLGQPDWGGFARLAHVIEQERGARHDSVLVLDGGDALGDSPIAAVDDGRLVVHLMNRMGYDGMVLGNHEFDYGIDSLYARRDEATFHLLGANLGVKSDRPPLNRAIRPEGTGRAEGRRDRSCLPPAQQNRLTRYKTPPWSLETLGQRCKLC